MEIIKDSPLTVDLVRRICFGVREREHFLFPISSNLLQYLVLSWDKENKQFITSILDQHDKDQEKFMVLMRPLRYTHQLQEMFLGLSGKELKIEL